MPEPLVVLDDRRVLRLLGDAAVLAAVPPLADAARKYSASNPKAGGGCGGCAARRKAAKLAAAGGRFTLGDVKSVIGTLSGPHVLALKKALNAVRYRVTYVSPGKRLVALTV